MSTREEQDTERQDEIRGCVEDIRKLAELGENETAQVALAMVQLRLHNDIVVRLGAIADALEYSNRHKDVT